MKDVLVEVRKELKAQADEKTLASFQRFFKEGVKAYGVKTAGVAKIAAAHSKEVLPLGKNSVFALCEDLLKTGYSEEATIAFDWAYRFRKDFKPQDFKVFERWLERYVGNWAKCDTLCNHTIGSFIEKYPEYIAKLKEWTRSKNRWVRRAAAVTLIVPAKHGKFLEDIFEISDSLMGDKDDLVQKGFGWLLKEASHSHREEVFDYIMRNRNIMPRTALRYAIEKMPPELKKQAMVKD